MVEAGQHESRENPSLKVSYFTLALAHFALTIVPLQGDPHVLLSYSTLVWKEWEVLTWKQMKTRTCVQQFLLSVTTTE
jgi:hypothetical protein